MNRFKNAIGIIKACGLNIKGDRKLMEEANQVERTIIEALEKQIPKQVELTDDCCICPSCRFDMMGVYDFLNDDTKDPSFCPECGQALLWED